MNLTWSLMRESLASWTHLCRSEARVQVDSSRNTETYNCKPEVGPMCRPLRSNHVLIAHDPPSFPKAPSKSIVKYVRILCVRVCAMVGKAANFTAGHTVPEIVICWVLSVFSTNYFFCGSARKRDLRNFGSARSDTSVEWNGMARRRIRDEKMRAILGSSKKSTA